jgi:hypothetical protein
MKPIIAKLLPKVFGPSTNSRRKYSAGGTARTSKMGYQMDYMSKRSQREVITTQIEGGGKEYDDSLDDGIRLPVQGHKTGIAVTTETGQLISPTV